MVDNMKFVPSLTPNKALAKNDPAVEALTAVSPVKPVQPRTLPLPVPHEAEGRDSSGVPARQENWHNQRLAGERRKFCRRIEHLPVLLELRSGTERRQRNQRDDDPTEHVDEQV